MPTALTATLFLEDSGAFSLASPAPPDALPLETLVAAARWVTTRRNISFERLFPDPVFSSRPRNLQALSPEQAQGMLIWLDSLLAQVPVTPQSPAEAPQLRSAILTLLSHLTATRLRDPRYAPWSEQAAARMLTLIEQETGPGSSPALRAHGIGLLQIRGPALSPPQAERALVLLKSLVRPAPPYDTLTGPLRVAMNSAYEFHAGLCQILLERGWTQLDSTQYLAPFRTWAGEPVMLQARLASPQDENRELADPGIALVLINRHAQLGSFDLKAAAMPTQQHGYKLLFNTQCAGLTTRYAISRVLPETDLYTSWDSTYFRKNAQGQVSESEGLDCFLALLTGFCKRESHAQLSARIQKAQWWHRHREIPGFVQFVGPSHPMMVGKNQDLNQDGRADFYDGFLDLNLQKISENLSLAARFLDSGVPVSGISGPAAEGLGWAVGSLNRVTQYSDLWAALPGNAELNYSFISAGFFDPASPPVGLPGLDTPATDLPALCNYRSETNIFSGEVCFHAHLSHVPRELKRLCCAAEAVLRANKAGFLQTGNLGRIRAMVLLTWAGLLEFPADQNQLDALWDIALKLHGYPAISRSLARRCITDLDHRNHCYYGSERGLQQLMGTPQQPGELERFDPLTYQKLHEA